MEAIVPIVMVGATIKTNHIIDLNEDLIRVREFGHYVNET